MKINNINKNFFKDLAKRTTACGLITTMLFCFAACGKKDKDKSSEIGFSVTTSDSTKENGLYNYVINDNGLVSENYDFKENLRDVSFAKISETKEYGTNVLNEKSTAFYRENVKMIWPDCFSLLYTSPAWLAIHNFDYDIKYNKLDEISGNSYVVVYSSMTAKRDLDTGVLILTNGQKEFKKGDNMSSIAIYLNDELIAYKQTGVGSECNNVIEGTIGNVDLALSTVAQYEGLTESKEISYRELYDYQEKINDEIFEKKLLKK